MKISVKLVYVVLALLAQAQHTFAQYFNKLHDCDSTYDYGMDVFLQPGGNYFVLGEIQKINTSHIQLFRAVISSNGDTLSNKKILDLDSTSIYLGDPGAAIQLSDGSYAIPGSLMKWLVGGNRCFGSFIKLKPDGDIQFIKTYTDTSKHADVMHCIALMPDGGYLIGGERGKNDFMARSAALLIRTDSLGDTLWTKTYSKIATQSAIVNTVIPLPDGRIVLGAQSRFYRWDSSYHWAYNHDSPWFLLLDSSGNVIRDTVYGIFFLGGGGYIKINMADMFM